MCLSSIKSVISKKACTWRCHFLTSVLVMIRWWKSLLGGEGAWLPISYRMLGRREVMGSSCSSSIQQPQTVSKTWLVSMLTAPAFLHQRADDHTWGSLPETQCPPPRPLSQEQTKLYGRGLALHCHYTLAMHQGIHLTSVKFLVAFPLYVCEEPIHSWTQLVFFECLKCTRHFPIASAWTAGEPSVVIHQSQFCLKKKDPTLSSKGPAPSFMVGS